MSVRPVLIIFLGGMRGNAMEEAVAAARRAATFDTIDVARSAGIERAIVLTDDPGLEIGAADVEVVVDVEEHHFGRSLAKLVGDRKLRSVVYIGGGSLPLLDRDGFSEIVARLESSVAVTNNRFSSDLIAWNADSAGLSVVAAQDRDNSLARALQESGVQVWEHPRTLETVLDIDSPADLAVMSLTGRGGPRLREVLGSLELDLEPYRRAMRYFVDRTAEVIVAGRVGTHSWQYLERETACRARVFAEERGLEADARAESGAARSLLGFFLESAGRERFFEALAEMGDAAFIDTRVLLAHARIVASRSDRFNSDARLPDGVENTFLRELTEGAMEARLPVLLGGHSLVSGGLMALNEYAWQQSEAGLLVNE